jgi:hypothetical protein
VPEARLPSCQPAFLAFSASTEIEQAARLEPIFSIRPKLLIKSGKIWLTSSVQSDTLPGQ